LQNGYRQLHRVFLFADELFMSLQAAATYAPQLLDSCIGAQRVFQIVDSEPEWKDAPDARPLPDARFSVRNGPAGRWLKINSLFFGYDPTRLVEDITLTAKPGETVALVGHTGSGKTSLVNLIAKFTIPTSGDLLIDGKNICSLTSASIHQQIAIVHQNNFLFTGSVFENIRFGKLDATDEEVINAARQLDRLDLLESLPQGLHTQAGEGGSNFSLGQRQLICFTRAFLANPRILILDEATSALDPVTEQRLQRASSRLLAGRTSFVIAHRLSTIRQADQIVVLDHGRILERGTHRELLLQRRKYYDLTGSLLLSGN